MIITWGAPQLFIPLGIVCILLIILLVRQYYWQKKCLHMLVAPEHEQVFLRNFSRTRKKAQVLLLSFGLFFLVLALARPQWNSREEHIAQEGRDIIIALDVSRSMLAQDIKPSRLEHAKAKIKKLVSHTKLATDRVGLLIFSGDAFLLCPLTTDLRAFDLFLDSINHETLSSGGTALDKALMKVIEMYHNVPARKSKLLVIYTDGEDFSTQLPDTKQKLQAIGVRVFTLGVGTAEGAPIPVVQADGKTKDYQKDKAGNIIISRLDQSVLQKLAQDTGAAYIYSSQSDSDIEYIVHKLHAFEKEQFADKKVAVLDEQYFYCACISLLALLIEWIW